MMVSINSLTFGLSGCQLQEQSTNHRVWLNSAQVAHRIQFEPGLPDWPFDLTDLTRATEFYRQQSAELRGVMLSLEVTTAAAGAEVLRGLFKYRASSVRMYYVGILWLPFQEGLFQINVEAMETGITGLRECFVLVSEPGLLAATIASANTPSVVLSTEELAASPPPESPSDDERWDNFFPDHPLTKVRRRITEVLATLELDASPRSLTPFRTPRAWS